MSRLSICVRANDSALNLEERQTLVPCLGAWENNPMIL